MMERFNNACSRTGPDLARVAKKYLPAMACDALSLVHSQNTPPLAEVRRERDWRGEFCEDLHEGSCDANIRNGLKIEFTNG